MRDRDVQATIILHIDNELELSEFWKKGFITIYFEKEPQREPSYDCIKNNKANKDISLTQTSA